ncbi:hypothetical protein SUGI_0374280 [Cryptomeria japonica]|nr:hypothetical protein SUGI_0374280 [Cryptomeria japonica]
MIDDLRRNTLELELKKRWVLLSDGPDEIFQCAAKSENYTPRLGYEVLREDHEWCEGNTNLFWLPCILPKVGAFTQLAVKSRILKGDRLMTMGIAGPFRCTMCQKQDETLDRIVIYCEVAQECWDHIRRKLGYFGPLSNTSKEFFLSWSSIFRGSMWEGLWIAYPATMVWILWKGRNYKIFNGKSSSTKNIIQKF